MAAREVQRLGRRFLVEAETERPFWDRFAGGTWEPETLAALARLTGEGVVFFDVGAWVGPTTLFAAAGGARVVALEPDPVAAALLRGNLALNPDLEARIDLVEAALWPRDELVRLAADRGRGGKSTSSTLHRHPSVVWTRDAITPAALAARGGEASRRVVKIDIEGGEYPLAGALRPLTRGADAVLLSLHPKVALAETRGLDRLGVRFGLLRAAIALRRDVAGLRARRIDGGRRARLPLEGDWLFEREVDGLVRDHAAD